MSEEVAELLGALTLVVLRGDVLMAPQRTKRPEIAPKKRIGTGSQL